MALVSNIFMAQYYGSYYINNGTLLLGFCDIFDIQLNKSDIKKTLFNKLDKEVGENGLIAIYREIIDEEFDKENNVFIEIYKYEDGYNNDDYINKLNPVGFAYIKIKIK